MAWKQIVNPNLDPVMYNDSGKVLSDWLGWCANYVRTAFNVSKKIPRAWWAWQQNPSQHTDRNFPVGVYFPIFFRYYAVLDNSGDNEWGHEVIAFVSQNGSMTIHSSPISRKPYADTWSSIAQVEQNYHCSFVGWAEHVNGTRVIEWQSDTPTTNSTGGNGVAEKITVDTSRILTNGVLARNGIAGRPDSLGGDNGGDGYVGQDLSNALVQQLFLSDEARQWRDSSDPNSITGINSRLAALDVANGKLVELQTALDSVTGDNTATKTQLKDALDKVNTLTSELKTATDNAVNTPPKQVVVDPTYFSVGQLLQAVIKKLLNK